MNILIYGDSQSGNTGAKLQKLLQSQGHSVKRVTKSGKSTNWLLDYAVANISPTWDRVYLFNGGNDPSIQSDSLHALLQHFASSNEIVYLGLPPATQITNIPLAKKVWGSASTDKFFPTTAKKREQKNEAYQSIAASYPGVTVLDFRHAPVSGAVTQPSGVVYPSQPDGIHTAGVTAQEVANWIAVGAQKVDNNTTLLAAAALAAAFVFYLSRKA